MQARPANTSLTNSDTLVATSFNTKGNWNSNSAPSAGSSYFTGAFDLQTPPDTNNYAFAGSSLTAQTGGRIIWKGPGVITITNLILAGGGIVNGYTGSIQHAGNLSIVADSYAQLSSPGYTNLISANITNGTGALTITGNSALPGNGALTLSGTNTGWTGRLIVAQGSQTNLPRLTINSETRLGGNPAAFTPNQLTLSNAILSCTAALTVSNSNRGITIGGTNGTVDTVGNAVTVAVPITGPASFAKAGTGTLTLSGNNSYTGDTVVTAGILQVGSSQSLPAGGGKGNLNISSGGTFSMNGVNVSCNALLGSGTLRNYSGVATCYVGGTDASCTFSGTVLGSSSTSYPIVRKVGAGTLTLAGTADNSAGVAIVDSGVLVLAKTSSSTVHSVGSTTVSVTVNSGAQLILGGTGNDQIYDGSGLQLNGGTADMSGRNESVAFLTGGSGTIFNSAQATLSVLTVGSFNGSGDFGGTLQDGLGILALSKTGTGTQRLTGAGSYSGGTFVSGGTLIVNGSLAGVCYSGAGTTLAGTAGVAGAANIGGVLQPGDPAVLGAAQFSTGPLTLGAGAALAFHLSGVTTAGPPFNDLLQVNGDLKLNTNTVSLTMLGTNLAVGTYRLLNYTGAKTGSFGPVFHNSRYTVVLDESVTNQINLVVSGGGNLLRWTGLSNASWDVASTTNWVNTSSGKPDIFLNLDQVLFDDTPGVPTNVTLAVAVDPAAVTINAATNNFVLSGSGKITGAGGLTKLGASTLTLSNANDFTGPVVIQGGTVSVGNSAALGASSQGVFISNGGALDVNGISLGAEPVFVSGSGPAGGGAILDARLEGPRNLNVLSYVTLLGDTTFGGGSRWDIRNGSFTGQGYSLTKVGIEGVGLASVGETGLGDIFVKEGWLGFEYTATLGDPTKQLLLWTNTGVWFHSSSPLMSKLVSMTNASLFADSGVNILVGPVNLYGACLMSGSNLFGASSLELRGPVSGPGMLTSLGAFTLVLSATNSYTGGTLISAGTVQLGNGGVGGDAGPGSITNNATLQFNRSDDFVWNRNVSGSSGQFIKLNTDTVTVASTVYCLAGGGGAAQVNGGSLVLATNSLWVNNGEFWVAQGATTGACLINGGSLIVSNWIAVGRANAQAAGTLTLNSGNIFKWGANNVVLGSLGGTGTLTLNGGAFNNNSVLYLGESATGRGYLNLNGGLLQATRLSRMDSGGGPGLEATARFNGGTLQAVAGHTNFITLDNAWVQAGGLVFDDAGFAVTNNQPLLADTNSLGGGLTKLGTGSLTLTATNTFTGPTLLTAGSLAIRANGSIANSSLVSLAPGTTLNVLGLASGVLTIPPSQTLAGFGTILGNLLVQGTLIPGQSNALGTLTASNNVTLAGATLMEISRAPGALTNDLLRGVSNLICGGTLIVTTTNSSADFTDGDTFKLFDAASFTGSFTSFVLPDFSPCLSWDTSKLAVNGTLKLVAAAGRPVITQQPAGRPVLPGTAVTLQVQSTGGTVTNYQWYFNGFAIPAQTNRTFTITSMDATNFGAYSVLVSGGACSTLSQPASLVPVVPPRLTAPAFVDPVMLVSFTSQVGPTYVVEYTDVLPAASWTLLSTRAGTGGTITVVDTTPSATGRFYRVRVQ
jgi:fibronectin-binding autotransporter adhesin